MRCLDCLPVISAVHSHCYTGALELALAGDLIIASEDAKFADTHAKWALTRYGMSQRLPRRVGRTKAMEMMLTARTVGAEEAAALELANQVLPAETSSSMFITSVRKCSRCLGSPPRQQTTDARHGRNGP